MKKLIITALATLVAFYSYSQDYLPLTGGTLTGGTSSSPTLTLQAPIYPMLDFTSNSTDVNNRNWRLTGVYHSYGNFEILSSSTANSAPTINRFTINRDGNVGIGTPTPYSRLDINNGNIRMGEILNNSSTKIGRQHSANNLYYSFVDFQSTSGEDAIAFSTHLSGVSMGERMRITGAGDVGIGTSTPYSRLDINNGNIRMGEILNNSSAKIGRQYSSNKEYYSFIDFQSTSGEDVISFGTHLSGVSVGERMRITGAGDVGIGTTDPKGYKLAVAGKIRATEIKVEALPWSDFVFEPSYKLRDLKSTEQFIKENKHLPEIPSAAEVAKDGINVGEMDAKLLQKIEELTLYMIEQNKRSERQDKRIEGLERQLKIQ